MNIEEKDIQFTYTYGKAHAIIQVSAEKFPAMKDHIVESSKVYNEILSNIKYDKLKCLCKLGGYCSYCKHRIQLEMILE